MNIAIISSIQDKASTNIKERLISDFDFNKLDKQFDNNDVFQCTISNNANNSIKIGKNDNKIIKIYTVSSKLIHADDLDKKIDADLFIFISKHVAKEEVKSLTVHPIGNFGKAEYGGREKVLCVAPAIYLKNIFLELEKNSHGSGYELTMEVTHHGPFLEKPVLFVEIGSTEKEWVNKEAGGIIAKSVINVIKKDNNSNSIINNGESTNKNSNETIDNNLINNESKINNEKNLLNGNGNESVFVIGGSHYNHVANKVMLKTDMAVGHMCAKYNLENLDEEMIKKAMEKTFPKAKFVLLDWKGLGKEKQRIVNILEKSDIVHKRSDKFFD